MAWTGDKNNKVPNIGSVKTDYSNDVVQKSDTISEKTIEINRAEQIRRDKDTQKDITFGFIDIDNVIINQLEKFQLSVDDNGQSIKVPSYYASPEKWKSIQTDGFMRDYNGKIILPAIVFSRTTSAKDDTMRMFNRYLKYSVMKKYDQKNRYTPFNLLIGQNVPINDIYGIVMPDHMIFTYHFIVWSEYQSQINKIVERINFETEDYWGEKRGYRFRTKLDNISHTIQLSTDQDRMVKAEFDLVVNGYLLPDIINTFDGRQDTTQKWLTPKKIVIDQEVVASNYDMASLDNNSEKWRSQAYHNLPKNEEILTPPSSISDTSGITSEVLGVLRGSSETSGKTLNVVPLSELGSSGQAGSVSYDDKYFYIYTGNQWRRVAISQFE